VWDNFTEADLVVEENSNILAFGKATPGEVSFRGAHREQLSGRKEALPQGLKVNSLPSTFFGSMRKK
jgi:hypothetical protein